MKRIIVTGGAGFIGSALVRYLIKRGGVKVLNVDKLTYAGNLDSLKEVSDSEFYSFAQVDICDKDKISALITEFKPHAIMHLAAESHVDRSIDGPSEFIQTNIVGTATLLECATAYWRTLSEIIDQKSEVGSQKSEIGDQRLDKSNPQTSKPSNPTTYNSQLTIHNETQQPTAAEFRFLHISTDEVYGSLGETGLFCEETSYDPRSPYSASKASSDHLVMAWHHTYGLPVLMTNCSNNYGPFHFPEKLIPLVILNALDGKPLPIYGKGDNIRDWLYVDDHAKALTLVLEKGIPGQKYNVGGSNERTNLEVVETICDVLDKLCPIIDDVREKWNVESGTCLSQSSANTATLNAQNSSTNQPHPLLPSSLRPLSGRNSPQASGQCGSTQERSAGSNQQLSCGIKSYKDLITFVSDRPGHDKRYAIDATKLKTELGWKPEENFDTGIEKTIRWYLDNEWWWAPLRDQRYAGERLGKA